MEDRKRSRSRLNKKENEEDFRTPRHVRRSRYKTGSGFSTSGNSNEPQASTRRKYLSDEASHDSEVARRRARSSGVLKEASTGNKIAKCTHAVCGLPGCKPVWSNADDSSIPMSVVDDEGSGDTANSDNIQGPRPTQSDIQGPRTTQSGDNSTEIQIMEECQSADTFESSGEACSSLQSTNGSSLDQFTNETMGPSADDLQIPERDQHISAGAPGNSAASAFDSAGSTVRLSADLQFEEGYQLRNVSATGNSATSACAVSGNSSGYEHLGARPKVYDNQASTSAASSRTGRQDQARAEARLRRKKSVGDHGKVTKPGRQDHNRLSQASSSLQGLLAFKGTVRQYLDQQRSIIGSNRAAGVSTDSSLASQSSYISSSADHSLIPANTQSICHGGYDHAIQPFSRGSSRPSQSLQARQQFQGMMDQLASLNNPLSQLNYILSSTNNSQLLNITHSMSSQIESSALATLLPFLSLPPGLSGYINPSPHPSLIPASTQSICPEVYDPAMILHQVSTESSRPSQSSQASQQCQQCQQELEDSLTSRYHPLNQSSYMPSLTHDSLLSTDTQVMNSASARPETVPLPLDLRLPPSRSSYAASFTHPSLNLTNAQLINSEINKSAVAPLSQPPCTPSSAGTCFPLDLTQGQRRRESQTALNQSDLATLQAGVSQGLTGDTELTIDPYPQRLDVQQQKYSQPNQQTTIFSGRSSIQQNCTASQQTKNIRIKEGKMYANSIDKATGFTSFIPLSEFNNPPLTPKIGSATGSGALGFSGAGKGSSSSSQTSQTNQQTEKAIVPLTSAAVAISGLKRAPVGGPHFSTNTTVPDPNSRGVAIELGLNQKCHSGNSVMPESSVTPNISVSVSASSFGLTADVHTSSSGADNKGKRRMTSQEITSLSSVCTAMLVLSVFKGNEIDLLRAPEAQGSARSGSASLGTPSTSHTYPTSQSGTGPVQANRSNSGQSTPGTASATASLDSSSRGGDIQHASILYNKINKFWGSIHEARQENVDDWIGEMAKLGPQANDILIQLNSGLPNLSIMCPENNVSSLPRTESLSPAARPADQTKRGQTEQGQTERGQTERQTERGQSKRGQTERGQTERGQTDTAADLAGSNRSLTANNPQHDGVRVLPQRLSSTEHLQQQQQQQQEQQQPQDEQQQQQQQRRQQQQQSPQEQQRQRITAARATPTPPATTTAESSNKSRNSNKSNNDKAYQQSQQ